LRQFHRPEDLGIILRRRADLPGTPELVHFCSALDIVKVLSACDSIGRGPTSGSARHGAAVALRRPPHPHAVVLAAQTHDHVAPGAVVHVHGARPEGVVHIEPARVAVVDTGVDHGREQVVGRGDGVEIPVEVEVIMSLGTTCDFPPPVAPPLSPKTGPSDSSLSVAMARRRLRSRAWVRPMETTVFPSPWGVGEMAVTRISFPGVRGFEIIDFLARHMAGIQVVLL
jgi:hypothetical protein